MGLSQNVIGNLTTCYTKLGAIKFGISGALHWFTSFKHSPFLSIDITYAIPAIQAGTVCSMVTHYTLCWSLFGMHQTGRAFDCLNIMFIVVLYIVS